MRKPAKNLTLALTLSIALTLVAAGTAWWAYGEVGKTPGELMDYAELRLQGHNKLEWVALPAIGHLRSWLDQPSRKDQLKTPFFIPPPPTLRSAQSGIDAPATQRVLRVGPLENIRTIAQAAKLAKDGDIVEIAAGEYVGDVALWYQQKLTIRGRGGNARLFAGGKAAEGKAIWVIRNGDFVIENIDFIGAKVGDHNGSGIRFEGGNLHIKNCLFYANDTGLLVNAETKSVNIENSEFAYNGFGDGQSHNLYVGKIETLKITGSYFHHVNVGHHIKSRAQHNHIYYNRITDENGGRASYEIDLPNGGTSYVVGNIIQQGTTPQNSTIVSYGTEGLAWPENRLYLASNTLVNDQAYGGTFLRTVPGTQQLVLINNLLVGKGKLHTGTVQLEANNNPQASWEHFEQASRYDYRLSVHKQLLSFTVPNIAALAPQEEYIQPLASRPLAQPPTYPGALQTQPSN